MLVILSKKSSQFIRDKVITDTKSPNCDTDLPRICYHLSMDFFCGRSLNKGIREVLQSNRVIVWICQPCLPGNTAGFDATINPGSKPGRPSKRRS